MRIRGYLTVLSCLLFSLPAMAASFHLTFTDPSGTGNVVLNGSLVSSGEYLISSASGTINGSAISSLLAPGGYPSNASPNDNELFYPLTAANTAYADYNGISFLLAGGNYFNFYYYAPSYSFEEGTSPTDQAVSGSLSSVSLTPAAVTPEPSSLLLLGTGVLGIAATLRRRLA